MRVDTKEILERKFKLEFADVSTAERAHIISIILAVLRYRPGEHLTATQLLHHPSFKALNGALIAYTGELYCRIEDCPRAYVSNYKWLTNDWQAVVKHHYTDIERNAEGDG
ncbi:hypothetical protein PABG_11639 [Paracoccidioides brasiliensis Pb03]|nr:hypothetical protein PABG_11639 [Paracoccidioides brasiliensis Pb03]